MNFGNVNLPIVLGGGALVGLFLLLKQAPAQATSVGINPTLVSGTVAMNTAALGSQVQLASINANAATSMYAQDTSRQAHVLDYLANLDNNQTLVTRDQIQSSAGITQSMISSSTMLAVDIQNNANRLAMAQQETQNERIRANSAVAVAQAQAAGQKAAAKASMIGNIVGGVSNLATSALKFI